MAGNDSVILRGRDLFEEAFREAASMHDNTERLSAVREAVNAYNGTVDRIFADSARSENLAWFSEVYGNSYHGLTLAVKDFMLSTQDAVDENTLLLRDNAYRAITPGVITLGIALILIIVFFGLLDVYYIKPVVRITRGLGNFIKSRIPFSVKIEGRDEILELRDNIEDIIDIVKKKD